MMREKACVILAAGEGKRMQSGLPKVLHDLAGKPIVLHVLDAARSAGLTRLIAVVGEDHDAIRQAVGDGVEFVIQKQRLGTGHALQQAQDFLGKFQGDLVILCGDAPLLLSQTIRSLMEVHHRQNNACTVLTAEVADPAGYGRIVRDKKGNVVRILEEKEADTKGRLICEVNSGAYCLRVPECWQAISKIKKRSTLGEMPLTDIVQILLGMQKKVGAYAAPDGNEILGINSRRGLALAQKVLQERIAGFHMDNGVTIIDPANTYIGCEVQIGLDSVIEPFTVIEGAVHIGSCCVVGPFAHLRNGTVLENGAEIGNFVEVKKCRIGAGSKAKHLTYLGDTTLGRKVNIGAGTITANYDGVAKHPTCIGDGASIGSNTTLVAPVKVGDGAVTGAGSVVLKNRDVPPGAVVAGVPAKVIKSRVEKQERRNSLARHSRVL